MVAVDENPDSNSTRHKQHPLFQHVSHGAQTPQRPQPGNPAGGAPRPPPPPAHPGAGTGDKHIFFTLPGRV